MKKKVIILLAALVLALTIAACGRNNEPEATPAPAPTATPAPTPTPAAPTPEPVPVTPSTFMWNDYAGRDPNARPEFSTGGVNIWWDNWYGMRAAAADDHVQIQFRPGRFDPEDYDDLADFYARPTSWMSNWGEAVNMWALDDVHFCRYLVIRVRGGQGGEENALLLHFQPNDGPLFAARFSDLVTREGGPPQITTSAQDIYIDLEASGFPGMTNRMHIRAFDEATIHLYQIHFSDPVAPVDATSNETIHAGFTVAESAGLETLVPGVFPWNNFIGRDPNAKPDFSTGGVNIWWDNWANLRAEAVDEGTRIEFRPAAFDADDYDDLEDYYAHAMNWMGNWGEAVNMWALDNIHYCRYLVLRMRGALGGEENNLLLHFQPEDGPIFVARFADLVARGGGNVVITDEMEEIHIDLAASGFPGMTNRMHIRAFAPATVYLQEIRFEGFASALNPDAPLAGITQPNKPMDALDMAGFVAAAN